MITAMERLTAPAVTWASQRIDFSSNTGRPQALHDLVTGVCIVFTKQKVEITWRRRDMWVEH